MEACQVKRAPVMNNATKSTDKGGTTPKHALKMDDGLDILVRPYIMYSREELLVLSRSPLVHVPVTMPSFEVWFG